MPTVAASALICLVLLSGVLTACGGAAITSSQSVAAAPTTSLVPGTTAATTTPDGPPSVNVTEKNFAILPASPRASAGLVDFAVTDNGPDAHEFLIFRSDLTPEKFPMKAGRVDESGDGINKVFDSGANIGVHTTQTFHAALTEGNYYLVCNLPGHFLAGMHTAFTVTPATTEALAIRTTEKDFSIVPAATTAKAGMVDFTVTNNGPSQHEFLIFRTQLASDKLPLGPDGRVDEAADGLTKVFDSGSNIAVNSSRSFHAALTAGNYILVCNLPGGHYVNGMHTAFSAT